MVGFVARWTGYLFRAAKELLEAVIINPNNLNEIAESLLEALEMPERDQIRRNTVMQERLQRYDVVRWAGDFMEELRNTDQRRFTYSAKLISETTRMEIIETYRRSSRRLILLDYDGTLVPFARFPDMAIPGEFLLGILHQLSEDPRNDVVLVSGRRKDFLDRFFSAGRIGFVAEQGAWIKQPGLEWKALMPEADEWKPRLRPLLQKYVDRIAGSFVEEKDFALIWHYRAADAEPGKLAAQELKDHLLALTANLDVHILQGNKTIEIRMAGVNKKTGAFPFVSGVAHDFFLCIGDDENDEDLFGILPENAYSIHVGLGRTNAQHTLPDVKGVVLLLNEMAQQCAQETLFAKSG